jgi:hypothetical protein
MDFVKEGKLEEEKKRRQAEWERVRNKETDPIGKLLFVEILFSNFILDSQKHGN